MQIMKLRLPPKIKILEAAATIADGRVYLDSPSKGYARVVSSDGSRTYTVYVSEDLREACSTDNGTVYRGYVGYPIIAVLMLRGILPYDERVGKALAGINWRSLNEKYKKYFIVEKIVKNIASKRGVSEEVIEQFKESVYSVLKGLNIYLSTKCRS
jgi:hypothetical protein